jgi:hypothetical protein
MPECAINSLRVHPRHIKVSLIYLAIWELSLSSLAIASQAKLAQSSLTSDQSLSYLNTVEDLLLWREDCKVAEGCRKVGGSGRWLRFSVYRCEKVELIMGNVDDEGFYSRRKDERHSDKDFVHPGNDTCDHHCRIIAEEG